MKAHENDNQKRNTNYLTIRTGVRAGSLGFVSTDEVAIAITNNHRGVDELVVGFDNEVGIDVTHDH